jgi:pseudo-rSAM protein
MNNNRYWFNINPDTFLWKTNEKILLYNVPSQKSLTFKNNKDLNAIVAQLLDMENLYCIELAESKIQNSTISKFVESIVNVGFGSIVKAEEGVKKPAFFVPVLKLQNKMKKVDRFVMDNANMLSYLHEIDIYVREMEKEEVKDIPFADLLLFLNTFIKASSLFTINIFGDNLLECPLIVPLMGELIKIKLRKVIHIKLEHLLDGLGELLLWKSIPDQINIIYSQNIDLEIITQVLKTIKSIDAKIVWQFQVYSEQDYDAVENFIDSHEIESYELTPVFNGTNHDFFEKHIYLTEEDIQNFKLTKREIFAHQVLNTNNFGKLIIKADGTVYANLYQSPLGTINDPINEMLCKELSGNFSWLKIRDIPPCNDCVYQWLCPSPGNYELSIGKSNLCHIIA